jgi:hypothetical protein
VQGLVVQTVELPVESLVLRASHPKAERENLSKRIMFDLCVVAMLPQEKGYEKSHKLL